MLYSEKEEKNLQLLAKINKWLDPPNYDEVSEVYRNIGKLKSSIRSIKGQIVARERDILANVDKPRSNEAKLLLNAATADLQDEVAILEASLEALEQQRARLEYHLKMYQHALYHSRMLLHIDV